ncbi:MAG: KpsF/GutQ family sugar-phosphate isomerase [Chlamydiales bacterium]|nr:KpsF/GutQ family sugar-phosphate isomerase [Chlamydiales bacterium]
MMKQILINQKRYLDSYFEQLDLDQVDKAVEACFKTPGLIVFTGVGKSGLIAEKIVMTLVSTGTKALYLPPTNFLHGDIGILSEKDMLVMISRSGETEELLSLIPFARKRNTRLFAIVSNPESRLAKLSDLFVHLPFEKELCPFNLAPTTSTCVQLLFGDLLSVALMHLKEFNLEAYVSNHPAGSIGKKMILKVADLMFSGTQIPLCHEEDHLIDVLVELSNKKCGALLIVSEERDLLGIFTDGDLRRSLQMQGPSVLDQPMKNLMTRSPMFVNKDELAWDALKQMQRDPKKYVMVLPVLDQGKVAGILHMHMLVQAGVV